MISQLIQTFLQAFQSFVEYIFNAIFGDWNWQILFNWLPADFLEVCSFLIIFFFALMLIKWIRNLLPF